MILITSAKYLNADFTLEFGQIVPAFLPLGNKRLYEYQVALFKESKAPIYLSLPKDFKLSSYDRAKLKSLNITPLFVPTSLNLGQSVVYCLNLMSDLEQDLTILHGDSFFKDLKLSENSLSVARVKENYDWAYLDEEFTLTESPKEQNLILSGAFHFQNPRLLIKNIVEQEYNFIKGVKAYSTNQPLKPLYNETWLDFGLITNYFHSKKIISTQRAFNKQDFANGTMRKSSSWHEKIEAESFWFENLPKELFIYTPKFQRGENEYFLEYLYNNNLAELFVFGNLPSFIWKRIFQSLKEFLDALHSFKGQNLRLDFDYQSKTLQRLKDFSKQSGISLDERFIINDKEVLSLNELLQKLSPLMKEPQSFCLIHGDFCFSNIMFDFRAGMIKTYDPRGLDFSGKITNYGDENYDFAKLFHSVLGLYDFIMAGFFRLEMSGKNIQFELENSEELAKIQATFLELFKPDKALYALTIHLFLSMLPLHNDDSKRQMALLANAYRLYDEFFKEGL